MSYLKVLLIMGLAAAIVGCGDDEPKHASGDPSLLVNINMHAPDGSADAVMLPGAKITLSDQENDTKQSYGSPPIAAGKSASLHIAEFDYEHIEPGQVYNIKASHLAATPDGQYYCTLDSKASSTTVSVERPAELNYHCARISIISLSAAEP